MALSVPMSSIADKDVNVTDEEIQKKYFGNKGGYTDEQIADIEAASKKFPVLRSANMSLGINVISKLTERGVEQNVVDSFIAVLSDCEFARYAPTSDPNMAKEKIYQQASDVITQMNASIKK